MRLRTEQHLVRVGLLNFPVSGLEALVGCMQDLKMSPPPSSLRVWGPKIFNTFFKRKEILVEGLRKYQVLAEG